MEAVTAALQGLAAKDVGQAAVGLASPYLNAEIKKYTEGDTQANLIAHALLGAVEAAATGNNVLAGAAAGAGSEAAADFIVKTLYKGKSTQDLTEAEKQNVTLLSQLASGLASGLIGDSTQSAAVGADIGKRAVENNFLKLAMENPDQIVQLGLLEKGEKVKKEIEEKAATEAVEKGLDIADEYLPHYVTINGELYYISVKGVINLRNGDAFLGGGVSPIALPSRGIGASASFGWAVNLERKDVLGKRVTAEKLSNDVISGTSASVSGCYYACIGYGQTISSNPKDKSYKTFEIGIGVGLKGNIPDPSGGISEEKIIKIGE
ncbi:VENN motif pre-toxin domain-containing protein [Glaesserella parasuis]|uniref:VENN motif pre-toxin domain-containing protein n=1 Tax=Glaesserella parasuis TaxID=738 RepID=UPI001952527D|nr:VENN motif pre-toxin domain-containing protein [Glaesserella parasuis]